MNIATLDSIAVQHITTQVRYSVLQSMLPKLVCPVVSAILLNSLLRLPKSTVNVQLLAVTTAGKHVDVHLVSPRLLGASLVSLWMPRLSAAPLVLAITVGHFLEAHVYAVQVLLC